MNRNKKGVQNIQKKKMRAKKFLAAERPNLPLTFFLKGGETGVVAPSEDLLWLAAGHRSQVTGHGALRPCAALGENYSDLSLTLGGQ